MKLNTEDIIVAAIITVIAIVCFGCAIHYERSVKKALRKIDEISKEAESSVIHYDNPADYYLDWFFRQEKGFKENDLGYIIGKDNLDTYTVDADYTVQRKLDEALWSYCLRTSDLFGCICGYMNDKRNYDDRMFDVLATIVHSQETYVQKYGSDLMKTNAKCNTFKFEEEKLTEVLNNTFHKTSGLMNHLKEINK